MLSTPLRSSARSRALLRPRSRAYVRTLSQRPKTMGASPTDQQISNPTKTDTPSRIRRHPSPRIMDTLAHIRRIVSSSRSTCGPLPKHSEAFLEYESSTSFSDISNLDLETLINR